MSYSQITTKIPQKSPPAPTGKQPIEVRRTEMAPHLALSYMTSTTPTAPFFPGAVHPVRSGGVQSPPKGRPTKRPCPSGGRQPATGNAKIVGIFKGNNLLSACAGTNHHLCW